MGAASAGLIYEGFNYGVLSVALGFVAGAMIWMVLAELIPEALDDASSETVALTASLAIIGMLVFQVLLR